MELIAKPKLPNAELDRKPIYASSWLALFFALRREYQLARSTR